MARTTPSPRKHRTPSYRRQGRRNGSDLAFVQIDGRRHYLGPYDTAASREQYHRTIAEWEAALKEWRRAHHRRPHQLRHNYATNVRREFGLEAAQILLGHSSADVTQIYAERDMGRAARVAAKIG